VPQHDANFGFAALVAAQRIPIIELHLLFRVCLDPDQIGARATAATPPVATHLVEEVGPCSSRIFDRKDGEHNQGFPGCPAQGLQRKS
jgi:hypothetical protein